MCWAKKIRNYIEIKDSQALLLRMSQKIAKQQQQQQQHDAIKSFVDAFCRNDVLLYCYHFFRGGISKIPYYLEQYF